MNNKEAKASELLQDLVTQNSHKEFISIKEISNHLSQNGLAVLMILFAFPMVIPLPYPPGFTTILGLPLIFFSIEMLLGLDKALLPAWIANKTIKITHLTYAVEKSAKYFIKIENFFKPRMHFFSSIPGKKIIGFFSLLCAFSVTLPIFFGNMIPSAGIMIMALGLLSKDGIVILIGIIVSIFGLTIAGLVVYLFFYGAKLAAGGFLKSAYYFLIEKIGISK